MEPQPKVRREEFYRKNAKSTKFVTKDDPNRRLNRKGRNSVIFRGEKLSFRTWRLGASKSSSMD